MRIFAALDLAPGIRQHVSAFIEELRQFAPDAKWVAPQTLHVTLKFMGQHPPETVERIRQTLAEIDAKNFRLVFRGCGFFPSPRVPRVFWIGIVDAPALRKLAQEVEQAVSKFGVDPEKSYTPHLTLARARLSRHHTSSSKSLNRIARKPFASLPERVATLQVPEFGTMIAREYFLFESKLSRAGPQYHKIAGFQLK